MKIEQKKFSDRFTFTFEPERLNFACQTKAGTAELDVTYADFPTKLSTRIEQNTWLKNIGYLWCALGVIQAVFALSMRKPIVGTGLLLLMGVSCLLIVYFTKVKYTIFTVDRGSVWVIQDGKHHDHIIDEIRSRRRNQLLAWYGELNLENGLEKEVAKFRWLAEQQVITEDEARSRIAQIHAALGAAALPASITIN